jgi:hypothetical protein
MCIFGRAGSLRRCTTGCFFDRTLSTFKAHFPVVASFRINEDLPQDNNAPEEGDAPNQNHKAGL